MTITIDNSHNGIRVLKMNRPEKKNALDIASYNSLASEIDALVCWS